MPRENKIVGLFGKVLYINEIQSLDTGEVEQIDLILSTMRRKELCAYGEKKTDEIPVKVRDKDLLSNLRNEKIKENDMIQAFGVICSAFAKKISFCKMDGCRKENFRIGRKTFVYPIFIRKISIWTPIAEVVSLTKEENGFSEPEKNKLFYERKKQPGLITESTFLGMKDGLANYTILSSDEDRNTKKSEEWLEQNAAYANRIFVSGMLTNFPEVNENEAGGNVTSYRLEINRKMRVKDDQPDAEKDFPAVKSLGKQAVEDAELNSGDIISIDGVLQMRKFKVTQECAYCNNTYSYNDNSLEIVPYQIEINSSEAKDVTPSAKSENLAILNGKISSIKKVKKAGIWYIGLAVNSKMLPKSKELKWNTIQVMVNDTALIQYLEENHASEQDLLQVYGSFCSPYKMISDICKNKECENESVVEYHNDFIHASMLLLFPLTLKSQEAVLLTKEERYNVEASEIMECIEKKKKSPGKIIELKTKPEKDGVYPVAITTQEVPETHLYLEELRKSNEVNNRILICGNLVTEPELIKEKDLTYCTYEISPESNVFIANAVSSGSVTVKSYGDQAGMDSRNLHVGSRICVDGFLVSNKAEYECDVCGHVNPAGQKMEARASFVEYRMNCGRDGMTEDPPEEESFALPEAYLDMLSDEEDI